MFSKILIANRGEIACRVAVYSEADTRAAHVAACDEAVCIGPPSEAMQAMGLKAESKRLMQTASVPLVPGYHGADQDDALLKAEAERIGFPVLIKASAGGGKGMREVQRVEDFDAALAACRREAQSSFGNDAVLIERLVQSPRHIEIQIFADQNDHVLWLFERDCSMRRRHQKVIEEAPAPGLPDALRRERGAAAVGSAGGRLTAPMPGRIIALHVQPGDSVQASTPLLVLEAMKMEHTLGAPSAGQVSEVLYAVGDQVSEGVELLRIEALKTEGAPA